MSEGVPEARSRAELMDDFQAKWALLQKLEYLNGTELLAKGQICRNIYVQEILVTELIAGGLIENLEPADLAGLAAAIVYSPKAGDPDFTLSPPSWAPAVDLIYEGSIKSIWRLAAGFSAISSDIAGDSRMG